jgi:hypothetical protein
VANATAGALLIAIGRRSMVITAETVAQVRSCSHERTGRLEPVDLAVRSDSPPLSHSHRCQATWSQPRVAHRVRD